MTEQAAELPGRRWLALIGIGEDGVAGLSDAAKGLIAGAEIVVGGQRHLMLARELIRGKALAWPSPIAGAFPEIVSRRGRPVVVLASGDPFFYGVGKQLAELVSPSEILCVPQPSAFSLAVARLGWALQDTALVSLHGRPLETIVRHLYRNARILALSWDGETPGRLARLLSDRGIGEASLTVLEALGGPRERVRTATAANFALADIDGLNTLAIALPSEVTGGASSLATGLDDSAFESDGQLTKREIRAVTLSSLAPQPGELLWDVGLGAGSVAIEWLLRHASMRAIGFEQRADRAEHAGRNAVALGAPELRIIVGRAPDAFAGQVPPDAIFVGGGMGEAGVFEAAWAALKPGGRLVANAVSLKTEQVLLGLHHAHGGDLIRLEVARAAPIGREMGWHPAKPVTHWCVRKPW